MYEEKDVEKMNQVYEGRKETTGRGRKKSIEWKNGKMYEVKCDTV